MFRTSLRRCAGRVVASSSGIVPRVAPVLKRTLAPTVARPWVSSRIATFTPRLYSTEAEAAAQTQEDAPDVTFESLSEQGVHPNLLRAITDDMGYDMMTPVQAKTIHPALSGSDIVAQAKTGTGKTLAFLLPMFQRMISEDPNLASRSAKRTADSTDIRGIVMSPTRELAEQIAVEARKLCRHTGLVVQSAVGGTQKREMLRQTQRQGCHLLVATPGRLNDILSDPRSGIDAPNLAALVLDEADRMLDVGFEQELNEILKSLPSPAEKQRQTMLVSATIPDNVIRLARNMVRADDFKFVQTIAANESLTHDRVPQRIVVTNSWANMFPSLFELMDREDARMKAEGGRPFKAIVYFNTTAMVQLTGMLAQERRRSGKSKIPCISINSKLTQGQRERAADMFKKIDTGILFSSDVTARGMDFKDVTHVIQMEPPTDRETYIHRLGRTARQGKEGDGILICPPQLVRYARKTLEGMPLQPDATLESAQADVAEASTEHQQEMKELGRFVHREVVKAAYSSAFGRFSGSKVDLVDDLNDFVQQTLGLEELPAFGAMWVRKMGLDGTNIKIEDRRSYDSVRERGTYGNREPRNSGDSFTDQFAGQIRGRDDEGRRGGGGFSRGGRGGGRGGGGGFSRGGDRGGDRRGGDRGGYRGSRHDKSYSEGQTPATW